MLKLNEYRNAQNAFKNIEDYECRDKITDLMIESVLSLETSLFSQMDSESKRINKIKETISRLEESLLDPEQIDKLDPGDKMALYNRLNTNLHKELALLQNLQHSIPQALDNIDSLDAIKSERRQHTQNEKEKEAAAATPSREKNDNSYLNKTVMTKNGETLGTITKIIDGNLAVLSNKDGNFVFPWDALNLHGDENFPWLVLRSTKEELMKGPPYKEESERNPFWMKAVRVYFAEHCSFYHLRAKWQEPIRETISEERDNGDQRK